MASLQKKLNNCGYIDRWHGRAGDVIRGAPEPPADTASQYLAPGRGLNALRLNGARLMMQMEMNKDFPSAVTDNPKECRGIKHAIVLVKSWQTERAAHQLKECLADDGLAITLQNGWVTGKYLLMN